MIVSGLSAASSGASPERVAGSGGWDRVALVTGGNKGIGKEIARKLGKEPNTICILGCRSEELGKAAVQELSKEDGCQVAYVRVDLEDTDTMSTAAKFIQDTYGRCDVLINNAGTSWGEPLN